MFLFIQETNLKAQKQKLFKYISCSYLSGSGKWKRAGNRKFKYISCSYLSKRICMQTNKNKKFKYISCSYLSRTVTEIRFLISSLNTSHVLIYLHISLIVDLGTPFKYISCSYLSYRLSFYHWSRNMFKYISCSYLSQRNGSPIR